MAITLDKYFELGENAEHMHPTALSEYLKFIDDLNQVVALNTITDEDVKRLLSGLDNWIYLDWLKGLQEWLTKCLAGNSNKTPSVYPGELPSWSAWWIKRLLKKVGSIKHEELVLAAVEKREKARALQEVKEKALYINEKNSAIEKLRKELSKGKKPVFSLSSGLAKYHTDDWYELEPLIKSKLEEWAAPHIKIRVPQILKRVVSWDIDWWVYPVPYYAKYEVIGVPCLTWCFKVMVILEVHLKLEETKPLGFFYLGPIHWENQEGFTTPITLLAVLAGGKLECDGIELIKHDGSCFCFLIQGYEDGYIDIHQQFRQFIIDTAKEKGLAEGLLAKGMIDDIIAKLLTEKVLLPLPAVSTKKDNGQFTGNDDDLLATLQSMGYPTPKIKAAMESINLSPTITFKKKIEAALKFLDSNSL